jgi:hypothetical protein
LAAARSVAVEPTSGVGLAEPVRTRWWVRVRSGAALAALLTVLGLLLAALVGIAVVGALFALRNAV